jgi:hypothetical protein
VLRTRELLHWLIGTLCGTWSNSANSAGGSGFGSVPTVPGELVVLTTLLPTISVN